MQWENPNTPKHFFYYDKEGNKKYNGIYSPGLDRWLVLDEYDYWVTLQTAQVLSSKIATMVYILPSDVGAMTNENCMNFAIIDKLDQKKGMGADLITSQIPTVRILREKRQLIDRGIPEDFKSLQGVTSLKNLKEYADFVHKCMYAIMLCSVYVNYHDNKTFSESFIPKSWLDQVWVYEDRSGIENGALTEAKRILYMSNDIDEAKSRLQSLWEEASIKISWVGKFFYRILDEGQIDLPETTQ